MVNNDERDTKPSTESHNLLTNCVAIGSRTVRFFGHDFQDGSVGDYCVGLLDEVVIQVTNERWLNVCKDNELRNNLPQVECWLTLLEVEKSFNFVFGRRSTSGLHDD